MSTITLEERIKVSAPDLGNLCRKWKICELALFGSVLRPDFRPDSDLDILLTFENDAPWSLWDMCDVKDDLSRLFGRPVDIVEKSALRNPFVRHEILSTYQVIYAA